ncbi:MAG: Immune inhibitor A peptidase M6 [Bacteroidetes bacterium ADurb.Bin408]|nr:MAG: Immune inhibitor A peptidase M6 [Bacteroidetes bacterium ADurb.Bin408]
MSSQIAGTHQVFFKYSIKNIGLDTAASFTVSVVPLSSNILSVGAPKLHNNLAHLQSANDSIAYTLNSGIVSGDTIIYLLCVNNGSYVKADTIYKIFGNNVTLFTDNASGMSHWISASWGTDSYHYYSAPSSIADSPFGNYSASDNTEITSAQSVNLDNAHYAEVSFMIRFNIAAGYDYVQFLITADNGITWTPLCGRYSVISGNNYIEGQPAYEGIQNDWVQEKINISEFIGNNVKFRFNLVSDWYPWTKPDGFYFDDFNVRIIDTTVISSQTEYLQDETLFGIYPNPVKDNLFVEFNGLALTKNVINIYNAIGQKVFCKESDVTKETINTSNWPEGFYFICVSRAAGTFSKKFIIDKKIF